MASAAPFLGATICSGIGGAEVAAPWIEWQWCSEIEPFPAAVLAKHFPNVPNRGDATKLLEAYPDDPIDILCGGTPCQSFSTMGRRQGLEDARGDLALGFCRLAEALRARWIVWENVPGVLTSGGGRDFAAFVGALVERGYSLAWRVLDVSLVRSRRYPRSIPQRRRRVYLVGCSRGRFHAPAEALLVSPVGGGDIAESRRERAELASGGSRVVVAGRGGLAHCLRASAGTAVNAMSDNFIFGDRPRRLSLTEMERLMGFPDGWTYLPSEEHPGGVWPDGDRRKALGNAWGVNCAEWVLDRIRTVDATLEGKADG